MQLGNTGNNNTVLSVVNVSNSQVDLICFQKKKTAKKI